MRYLSLVALGLAALLVSASSGADFPHAGRWKVIAYENAGEIPLWLIESDSDGKKFEILDHLPQLRGSKAGGALSGDARTLRFPIRVNDSVFELVAHVPKGKEKADTLLGSVSQGEMLLPVRLERTEEKTFDPKAEIKPSEGTEELKKAVDADADEREKALKAVLDKYTGKPVGYRAARELLKLKLNRRDVDIEGAKPILDAFIKEAATFGREIEINALISTARVLRSKEKTSAQALPYVTKAAELLQEGDSLHLQESALTVQAAALNQAGKADEAKKVGERLAKVEEQLDQEFAKNAIPFKPEPFKGRKGKSDRVVLIELFTGAQCPPCVAADIAFDAALKTYSPKDAVFLQYHLHIPGPDALTNADSVARAKYYQDRIEGTPTAFVDGVVEGELGGPRPQAKDSYEILSKRIDDQLEKESSAAVKLTATRKGDTIDLSADVSGLKTPGEKVKLRFVLVEEMARFQGSNRQRLHHHVVRAFPGGVEGFALEKADSAHKADIKLNELRKQLAADLVKQVGSDMGHQPELKKLKVVAFIQDEDRKILQAVQTDVPE
jgi:hypothetical protein